MSGPLPHRPAPRAEFRPWPHAEGFRLSGGPVAPHSPEGLRLATESQAFRAPTLTQRASSGLVTPRASLLTQLTPTHPRLMQLPVHFRAPGGNKFEALRYVAPREGPWVRGWVEKATEKEGDGKEEEEEKKVREVKTNEDREEEKKEEEEKPKDKADRISISAVELTLP